MTHEVFRVRETKEKRAVRVRLWAFDTAVCRRCGLRRFNVVHEPDPDGAPEGREYYAAIRHRMHQFEAVEETG